MILKQKKNCKMIFVNNKYYIKTQKNLYHFGDDFQEAQEYYDNIIQIEKSGPLKFVQGKFRLELYPEEMLDLIKALEIYKFSLDKFIIFSHDRELLKSKMVDIDMLTDFIFCFYNNYLEQVEGSGITKNNYDNIIYFTKNVIEN